MDDAKGRYPNMNLKESEQTDVALYLRTKNKLLLGFEVQIFNTSSSIPQKHKPIRTIMATKYKKQMSEEEI